LEVGDDDAMARHGELMGRLLAKVGQITKELTPALAKGRKVAVNYRGSPAARCCNAYPRNWRTKKAIPVHAPRQNKSASQDKTGGVQLIGSMRPPGDP
jgi:hypothetical protein